MEQDQNALLLRGNDGEVYFLGHQDLERYRLTGEREAAANASLDGAESDDVVGFEARGAGKPMPALHGTAFKSLVYAPVMKGYTFDTATPEAFVADSPPDGIVPDAP